MHPAPLLLQVPLFFNESKDKPTKSRQKKSAKKSQYVLKPLDEEILEYVRQYYVLTAWQLVKLHYSPGSLTRAQTKLQILSGNKKDKNGRPIAPEYLHRRGLYLLEFGNSTFLYFLGKEGIRYHKERGARITTRHRRIDKILQLTRSPLLHVLHVNDVLIAGRNLSEYAPDIRLAAWEHDYDLAVTPASVLVDRVHSGGGTTQKKVKINPDGLLDFRLRLAKAQKERRRILLLEIDRGTETFIDEFKRKISAYVHYTAPGGAFAEKYGKAEIRIPWIVTNGGINRVITLRQWCEEELVEQGLEKASHVFRFVLVDHVVKVQTKTGKEKITDELDIHPYDFFLTKQGYMPFSDEQDTLLWRP